jgi:hypothetical protein
MNKDRTCGETDAELTRANPAGSPDVHGWQPISTAPKDGTWFHAYRPSASFGVQATLVAVCWDQESGDFVWPTDIYDVFNPPDLSAHDERGFLEVDVYESQGSFTHWQPLPSPPVQS